ncbi:MAG: nicotinamide mononucleotide transporter [Gammaproteobacteria bacterium]|nr:nicotinamide mononucleotide transporter [Gammaproteobacteria bacterium]
MEFNLNLVIDAFLALSGWEVVATIFGIIYVVLAAKESAWCWPAGFAGTLIYTVLFWNGQLPMQAVLNFYYMGMAVYGFILWTRKAKEEEDFLVSTLPLMKHGMIILVGLLLSLSIGYYLISFTETKLPYLDATVMIFSVIATWLLAQKILENWLYWIIIDSASILLFWQTGYYVTIILFIVYTVLAVYGYKSWRASLLQQSEG